MEFKKPSFWRGALFGLMAAYLFLLLNGGYSLLPVRRLYILIAIVFVVNLVVERARRPIEITTLAADSSRSKPHA
jgi:hypothetical protein